MKALESSAPLIVYVDVKSPYAFVAIRPTLALEAELGLQFDWRPLTLDIPSYLGSAEKKKGKVVKSTRSASQWTMVKYAYGDARRYAEQNGLFYLSPYNDAAVVAGQGTCGIEIAEQCPDVEAVFIAVGGGGLLSGVGSVLRTVNPEVRIVACQPAASARQVWSASSRLPGPRE